jgi:hypothetical protein
MKAEIFAQTAKIPHVARRECQRRTEGTSIMSRTYEKLTASGPDACLLLAARALRQVAKNIAVGYLHFCISHGVAPISGSAVSGI